MAPVVLKSWGKRQSKFNNRRVRTAAGVSFDSQSEARRWGELLLLQRAGEIRGLTLHPRFHLDVNGIRVADMIPDFLYECRNPESPKDWIKVCEDRKGGTVTQTREFKIKCKLMKAIHNIDILVTGKGT